MRPLLSLALLAALPVMLLASQPRRPVAPAARPAAAPAAVVPAGPPPSLPGAKGRVGMNLSGSGQLTSEYPFLDRMHYAGGWGVHYKPADPDLIDAQGWPKRMPPDGAQYDVAISLDPGMKDPYVLSWSGKGEVTVDWVRATGSLPHRITFVPTDNPQVHVAIAKTDPADPIRDMHLVRKDQEALMKTGELFNPVFIAKLRPFSPIRTMDWNCINDSRVATWSDRPVPTRVDWTCVPLEVQVALANELGADLWLPIPHLADDDYIRRATTYVRDHLDRKLRLQLEYSNEVWNNSFQQSKHAQAKADRLWGKGQPVQFGANIFYGYRAAQMAAIAREVYGAEAAARLQPILADFTAWTGPQVEQAMLDGIVRAGKGKVDQLFKALAVTTYFGDALGVGIGNDADRPVVYGWATSGAAGLDQAFAQLEHGKLLKADTSLDALRTLYASHAAWARAHGLALVAYEGGLSGYWFMAEDAKKPALIDFITRLKADPRFGGLYARMVRDFAAAGGSNVAVFNDTGPVSIWGPWGTLPNIYASSPGYDGLVASIGTK